MSASQTIGGFSSSTESVSTSMGVFGPRFVSEDWERGRCYLPKSWFRPDTTDNSPTNGQVRSSVKRILELADEYYYSIGNAGIHYLPASVRAAVRIASAVYREIGQQILRKKTPVMNGRVIVPTPRFAIAASLTWGIGVTQDLRDSISLRIDNRTKPSTISTELTMNDAKYLVYLGLSLTAFMGSALFLLVMFNPKDAAYSTLPMIYAAVCFAVGVATNLLAKKAETLIPVPVVVNKLPAKSR